MKIKRHTRIFAGLLSLLLSLSLAACASNTETTNADSKFKYGRIDIPGKDGALCGAPIYIAYDKGFFAEEGFDVNLISADAETRKIGLNNGTIPIVNGDFQFFPSIEEGVNVKVVDGLHNGCIKFIVKKGSSIRTAADLKGKKIAVDEIGGTPHQVASVWVEKAGISAKPEDKEVEFLVFSDGNLEIEALKKGDVDVAALWDPLGSIYTTGDNAKDYEVLFDLSTDPTFAGKYCCFLYASDKVIRDNPEKVAALLYAYQKAQDWIAKNPKEAVDIISDKKYSAIEDKALAEELLKSYVYPSAEDRAANRQDVGKDVEYFATELYNIGYLKTDPAQFAKDAYYKVDLKLGK
ncbi:NitT/TauT family transport system substrate-binding protein [Ruminiclostridium sufflavum DSM 19573]|uniref:NitT/TauT family transport system substrate-binding protein n=1 Tax=Ruminiclostridium sufflavum DSM 19573 TaxID=1121337 RepID=A0A318XLP5_9FIRM|nr:ABC transporter substrate-binding protein [Ruminiclostridium sufflavum]PYG88543.1 NitT/TauT family transport system substrate-binding protein [Ruminiclostridium sufflavum DSM 19573]